MERQAACTARIAPKLRPDAGRAGAGTLPPAAAPPGALATVGTSAATDRSAVANAPNRPVGLPTDGGVIQPVPGKSGFAPTQALMTLTTCNPTWNSSHRMIVFGHLVSTKIK